MVAQAVRIRLEEQVEQLEGELAGLRGALISAKALDFREAAAVLAGATVRLRARGDEALLALLTARDAARTELEGRVTARLQQLSMPHDDVVKGARWLCREPVRYEHHRLSLPCCAALSLCALPLLAAAWNVPDFEGAVVGLGVVTEALLIGRQLRARAEGEAVDWHERWAWSDVIITDHRMVLEGQAFAVKGLTSLALTRVMPGAPPVLELRYGEEAQRVRLGALTPGLRAALRPLGLR
jgi:hypothetical protein